MSPVNFAYKTIFPFKNTEHWTPSLIIKKLLILCYCSLFLLTIRRLFAGGKNVSIRASKWGLLTCWGQRPHSGTQQSQRHWTLPAGLCAEHLCRCEPWEGRWEDRLFKQQSRYSDLLIQSPLSWMHSENTFLRVKTDWSLRFVFSCVLFFNGKNNFYGGRWKNGGDMVVSFWCCLWNIVRWKRK